MKVILIDCRSGASGDMTLGTFLDLGVPRKVLEDGLASLGLNEFALEITRKEYNRSPVTDVDVILHNKEHAWIHPYSGKYRNYGEIKEMIAGSGITQRAKELARRIFDIKASAESVAHGVPVDEVQFHEVTARSVSLSWGAREVGSPCEWRGRAPHCSRAMVGCRGPAPADPGYSKERRRRRRSGNHCLIKC